MAENPSSPAQQRAEAKFSKQQTRQREGDAALAAYRAESRAIDARTVKLRAARLAKEAAEAAAKASAPPAPVKVKAVRAKAKKAVVEKAAEKATQE